MKAKAWYVVTIDFNLRQIKIIDKLYYSYGDAKKDYQDGAYYFHADMSQNKMQRIMRKMTTDMVNAGIGEDKIESMHDNFFSQLTSLIERLPPNFTELISINKTWSCVSVDYENKRLVPDENGYKSRVEALKGYPNSEHRKLYPFNSRMSKKYTFQILDEIREDILKKGISHNDTIEMIRNFIQWVGEQKDG